MLIMKLCENVHADLTFDHAHFILWTLGQVGEMKRKNASVGSTYISVSKSGCCSIFRNANMAT